MILSNLRCGIPNTPMIIKGVVQAGNNRTPLAIDPGQILAPQNPARKHAYVQNPDDRVPAPRGLSVEISNLKLPSLPSFYSFLSILLRHATIPRILARLSQPIRHMYAWSCARSASPERDSQEDQDTAWARLLGPVKGSARSTHTQPISFPDGAHHEALFRSVRGDKDRDKDSKSVQDCRGIHGLFAVLLRSAPDGNEKTQLASFLTSR
ncbi:hypothetical protein EDB84DRAFT_355670 [Lactarius hengduanensis]|nr:hypothetical protein EDB84DRAFT_355670 [Lactarius hengduanensis]